jgi:hypothetical protein
MATRNAKAEQAARSPLDGGVRPATIVELDEASDRARVRISAGRGATEPAPARIAHIPGYRATVGDRVLVASTPGAPSGLDLYVIAVLHAARAPAVTLPDGSAAEVRGGAIELRDPAGRLLVRYSDGHAEIAAPAGDLTLAAPKGRVVLQSGTDIAVDAARDVIHRAGRRIDLAAGRTPAETPSEADPAPELRVESGSASISVDRIALQAKAGRFAVGQVAVFARAIATTAERIATRAETHELTATCLVEKTRDALRDVSDLAETRIGRARTLVRDVYSLCSGRTVITSKEETTIDGDKILLG